MNRNIFLYRTNLYLSLYRHNPYLYACTIYVFKQIKRTFSRLHISV